MSHRAPDAAARAWPPPRAEAHTTNALAWLYLTGPAGQQIPGLAALLAERAVLLAPDNGVSWYTLGLAHYRLGRWQLAVDTLQHSIEVNHGQAAAYDLFFLAMSHARLGHRDQTRACYDRANAWWKAQKSLPGEWVAELTVFRAEAAALLR